MPPSALSPPALHFMIIDFITICGVDEFTFWCKTDTPCHLTLHLSLEEPIIRRIPYQKRGADFDLSSVTCFVEIASYDQTEPGDTTSHTFTVPLAAYCQQHYWYLSGTQGGSPCKSISQIFHVHCEQLAVQTCCHSTPSTGQLQQNVYPCWKVSYAFTPGYDFEPTELTLHLALFGANPPPPWVQIEIWTTDATAEPLIKIGGSAQVPVPGMTSSWQPYKFPLTCQKLLTNNHYCMTWWTSYYPRQSPYKQALVRRGTGDTCPYTGGAPVKTGVRNCYADWWNPCNCGGRPWNPYTNSPHYYSFGGKK